MYQLFDRLFADLDVIRREDDLTDLNVIQVKEKFGGLRACVRDGNARIKKRIWEAEDEAYATCETCGGSTPGIRVLRGYRTNVCVMCLRKRKH